jgi:hypothetical protein
MTAFFREDSVGTNTENMWHELLTGLGELQEA